MGPTGKLGPGFHLRLHGVSTFLQYFGRISLIQAVDSNISRVRFTDRLVFKFLDYYVIQAAIIVPKFFFLAPETHAKFDLPAFRRQVQFKRKRVEQNISRTRRV